MRPKSLLFAALFVLALAVVSWADEDLTTLRLKVVDEAKDRPVRNASVTVSFVAGRKLVTRRKIQREWNMKTNSRGLAEFPEMPQGKIKLQIIAAGYRTHGDELEISGEEQEITVKMKRPSGGQISAHEPAP